MSKHKHADLIHAWAEGAIIQCKLNQSDWVDLKFPVNDKYEYRIKPEEPKWWENIPEHGLLVRNKTSGHIYGVTSRDNVVNPHLYIPLTNEEIERFKR